MAESPELEDEIDGLYALRPGEFVGARDALAKRLRAAGRRDDANAVHKLARPTVAAWAINALVRTEPEWTQALVTAGRRLQEAQDALLEHGDRDAWREASTAQRAAVDRLARLAEELVRRERGSVSAAVRDAIRDTLQAATIDPGAREEICAGRLQREQRAVGMLGGDVSSVAGRRVARPEPSREDTAPREARAAQQRAEREARDALTRAERDTGDATTRARTAAQATARAANARDAAQDALAEAQRAADQRAAELAEAQGAQRAADDALAAAQTALGTARARLERTLSES